MVKVRLIRLTLLLLIPFMVNAAEPPGAEKLYLESCAACHGEDGRGRSTQEVSFELPLPDFTDCNFATREADADWFGIIHQGGPIRGFNRLMPSYGEALSTQDITTILGHIRTFCAEPGWPRGEFNLPRPLFTEKAFPEDESILTTTVNAEGDGAFMNDFTYEKRFGRRSMYEIKVPFGAMESGTPGNWNYGIGDIAFALKHTFFHSLDTGSIVSAGAEVVLPTGSESKGFGGETTIYELYLAYGQILANDAFLQVQPFLEMPTKSGFENEAGLKVALGRTWSEANFGRAWTPIMEALFARDLESGADTNIDIAPQLQVTLNTRQHVQFNIGVRIPVNHTAGRDTRVVFYFLWDWFDGGLLDGW